MQRQLAKQCHLILLCHLLAAAGPEQRLVMTAGAADVITHVLYDAEHRYMHLVEHGDALACVRQRHVLRGGDDQRRRGGYLLGQGELDVPCARRHVHHQIIHLAPAGLVQDLRQRLARHGTAPDGGILLGHQVTDAVALEATGHHRLHGLAVAAAGTLLEGAHHGRNGGTIDVRIQDGDPRPLPAQRQRQVDGGGGLAHPALAGGHHQDVANALHRRQLLGAGHARHLDVAVPVDGGGSRCDAQAGIEVLLNLLKQGAPGKRQHQLDGQALLMMLDGTHETGRHQIFAPPCRLKFGKDLFY
ncbi:hypothetical protein D3C79_763820 [compost metagenome]